MCSNENDRFTASTSTGNGALTYPIGLITADEVAYAGGAYGTANSSYYIAQNASVGVVRWWTMSPGVWWGPGGVTMGMFEVGGSLDTGYLDFGSHNNAGGVRPVVSLKSCVLASGGSGTASDPYTVELSDTCSQSDN